MMTTYTRRGPGQSYLKTVLADRINGLIELKDLDLEINPLKVYERMIEQIEEDTGTYQHPYQRELLQSKPQKIRRCKRSLSQD
jgi:hypothetical protein